MQAEDDIARIRRSWAKAAAGGEIIGTLFYNRLFVLRPDVRPLFAEGMAEQARKLMQTLDWIVDHLDDPSTLAPRAEALAIRHVHYGVLPDHYPAVGEALIDTLSHGLGEAFSPQDAAAWGRAFAALSGIMITAAQDANPGRTVAPG